MKRDRIVCECLKVTEREVCAAIREGRACTIREISACSGAGSGCTACHPALERMLQREAPPVYLPSSPSFSAR